MIRLHAVILRQVSCFLSSFTFNVFIVRHILIEPKPPTEDPCEPSPCGANALCQVRGDSPACSCLPDYTGIPPNCRPECLINPECPSQLACVNQKCRDPCPGSCGQRAQCSVINHNPVCTCITGFTGDPFTGCSEVIGKSLFLIRGVLEVNITSMNFTFSQL